MSATSSEAATSSSAHPPVQHPPNGWGPPYLLYLGNAHDELAAKTARGLAHWRPQWCIGQHRRSGCRTTVGLADMDFAQARANGANTMIVGVANAGGLMDADTVDDIVAALDNGMHVASGLHQRLSSCAPIVAAANRNGLQLFDARHPPLLQVGSGRPRAGRRLLTVGSDCSVGKMYATLALEQEFRRRGLAADFRATGQTGIFIAGGGVPIDAVVADFISGAAEWISPPREDDGWDLIEGQGSLFHPSYAGVSLGLLHGSQPDALVLCHEPNRAHMRGLPGQPLPDLRACLEANLAAARLTNPAVQVVGVALNTSRLGADDARDVCRAIEVAFDLPCQDPVSMGVSRIVDRVQSCFGD
ncbi:DUF1611 domain-containing protein [Lysobacter maris]|nr:DUF1611 domain-containing protein [Lysobacter maris]